MEEYDYKNDEVRNSLQSNKHNNITTCYYLLLKIKIRRGLPSVSDLISKEFQNYINDDRNLKTNKFTDHFNSNIKEKLEIDKNNVSPPTKIEPIEKNDLKAEKSNNSKQQNNFNKMLNTLNKNMDENNKNVECNYKYQSIKYDNNDHINNKNSLNTNKNLNDNITNIFINNVTYLNASPDILKNKIDGDLLRNAILKNEEINNYNNLLQQNLNRKKEENIKYDSSPKLNQNSKYLGKENTNNIKSNNKINQNLNKTYDNELNDKQNKSILKSEKKICKFSAKNEPEKNYSNLNSKIIKATTKNNSINQIVTSSIEKESKKTDYFMNKDIRINKNNLSENKNLNQLTKIKEGILSKKIDKFNLTTTRMNRKYSNLNLQIQQSQKILKIKVHKDSTSNHQQSNLNVEEKTKQSIKITQPNEVEISDHSISREKDKIATAININKGIVSNEEKLNKKDERISELKIDNVLNSNIKTIKHFNQSSLSSINSNNSSFDNNPDKNSAFENKNKKSFDLNNENKIPKTIRYNLDNFLLKKTDSLQKMNKGFNKRISLNDSYILSIKNDKTNNHPIVNDYLKNAKRTLMLKSKIIKSNFFNTSMSFHGNEDSKLITTENDLNSGNLNISKNYMENSLVNLNTSMSQNNSNIASIGILNNSLNILNNIENNYNKNEENYILKKSGYKKFETIKEDDDEENLNSKSYNHNINNDSSNFNVIDPNINNTNNNLFINKDKDIKISEFNFQNKNNEYINSNKKIEILKKSKIEKESILLVENEIDCPSNIKNIEKIQEMTNSNSQFFLENNNNSSSFNFNFTRIKSQINYKRINKSFNNLASDRDNNFNITNQKIVDYNLDEGKILLKKESLNNTPKTDNEFHLKNKNLESDKHKKSNKVNYINKMFVNSSDHELVNNSFSSSISDNNDRKNVEIPSYGIGKAEETNLNENTCSQKIASSSKNKNEKIKTMKPFNLKPLNKSKNKSFNSNILDFKSKNENNIFNKHLSPRKSSASPIDKNETKFNNEKFDNYGIVKSKEYSVKNKKNITFDSRFSNLNKKKNLEKLKNSYSGKKSLEKSYNVSMQMIRKDTLVPKIINNIRKYNNNDYNHCKKYSNTQNANLNINKKNINIKEESILIEKIDEKVNSFKNSRSSNMEDSDSYSIKREKKLNLIKKRSIDLINEKDKIQPSKSIHQLYI